ncbi:MAG: YczE/YyaS/YitT family protein [Ilumatobacteraceae bacterium]|jgi:uncharacterized membrane protein YczE
MPDRFLGRLARCLAGLACFGTGITLFLQSHLGPPPWDVFHKGVSEKTGLSIGVVIIGTGVLLLLFWIPLRQRPGIGTILNAIEIGLVVNLTKSFIGEPDNVFARVAMLVGGLVVIAFGSALYIGAGLGPGPRDGLMMGLAERGVSVRMARTILEIVVVIAGMSLGGSIGIGTLVFAVGIGPLVQWLLPRFDTRPVGQHTAH